MADYGGFEHNLQSLRVVDELEDIYADFPGLNLCYETREGILKHCSSEHAKQLGELGLRFLEKQQPSLEAQLTNIADEIAYNNHDVDDGLRSGLITLEQLNELTLFNKVYEIVSEAYPDLQGRRLIHEILRRLVGLMVVDLIDSSQRAIQVAAVASLDEVRAQPKPLMCYSAELRRQKNELKRFLYQNLYCHPKVYRMSWRATEVVKALFNVFMDDQKLLPEKYQALIRQVRKEQGEAGCARVISDYIAGMTDRYALRQYAELFDFSLIR